MQNMIANMFPSELDKKHRSQFQIAKFSLGRSVIQKPFDFFEKQSSILSNNKIILFDVLTYKMIRKPPNNNYITGLKTSFIVTQ